MSSASSDNRIRQIAILVSIVDSAAARQLMMHLPTETAKQVRAMAARLGPVSASERQSILAEFQKSALDATPQPHMTSANDPTKTFRSTPETNPQVALSRLDPPVGETRVSGVQPASATPESGRSAAPWTKFSVAALIRFIRDERPAVIAVVVSQLEPQVGANVLRALDRGISREVIRRLAALQDIDPEAKATIDEHLCLRLGECQPIIDNERENNRRLQVLIQSAPEDLQQEWQDAWDEEVHPGSKAFDRESHGHRSTTRDAAVTASRDTPDIAASQYEVVNEPSPLSPPTLESLYGESDPANAPQYHPELKLMHSGLPLDAQPVPPHTSSAARPSAVNHALPESEASPEIDAVSRARIQREFEGILLLPTHLLASLLSEAESETVLLALAGASHEFMQRFYRMLDRNDAKVLEQRLRRIGALKMSDIDEAQRRISQQAVALTSFRNSSNTSQLHRAA